MLYNLMVFCIVNHMISLTSVCVCWGKSCCVSHVTHVTHEFHGTTNEN